MSQERGMDRREALRLIGLAPVAATYGFALQDVERAAAHIERLGRGAYQPAFFDAHEWRTVHVLADLIIPRDERSGSATDARVPEFIDFMMNEATADSQRAMRAGLAWLDDAARTRSGDDFVTSADPQRRALLDEIAWPDRADPEVAAGVAFFNRFRDMTAAGFFSSRMGYQDLDYRGNEYRTEWPGCPEPALRKLGVGYHLMDYDWA
jgi:gluconate 2-dehydrogenase gamma chain